MLTVKNLFVPAGSNRLLIPETLRKNNLDLIRLLLAIGVIYCHSYFIYYGAPKAKETEPFFSLTQHQADLGGIAVDCFFVISGFLILNSYRNSSTVGSYLKKRVLRICPGFIVAFLVSVLVFAPLGNIDPATRTLYWNSYFHSIPIKSTLTKLVLFKEPYPIHCFKSLPIPNVINTSLWTIQFELICYLMVPLIALLGALKHKWISLSLFILFYGVLALQNYRGYFYFESHPLKAYLDINSIPRFFTYFLAGVCVSVYREFIPRNRVLVVLSMATLVFASVFAKGFDIVFPVSGSYLLFYLAYSKKIQFYDFARRGDISYGVYLYAWPIQQLLMYYLWKHLNPDRLFFMATVITMLIAYYWSWQCIEKPFLRLKKSSPNKVSPKMREAETVLN